MKKSVFNLIAQILRDYPRLPEYIKKREDEIMHPFNANVDENVGGGRAQFKKNESTELTAITLAQDRRLSCLENNYKVITKNLKQTDDITREIIKQLYFKEFPDLTLIGVSERLHISRSDLSKKRTNFFEKLAEDLGIFSI